VVLFDFSGVIASEGFRETLRALACEQGQDPEAVVEAGRDALHESGYVLGCGTEGDFWSSFQDKVQLHGSPDQWRQRILEGFRVRPGMLNLVGELRRAGHRVGLLTNHTDWLFELDGDQPFLACFDPVYNSFSLGRSKREPALFDDLALELGVAPGKLLLIDDSPEIVDRAREQGWQAVRFKDELQLRAELARRRVGTGLPSS
jgi:putative hydrolase of the HAD superfamily